MEPIWQTKIQMFLKSIPSKTETDRITIINLVELLLNTKLKTYKCILHEINIIPKPLFLNIQIQSQSTVSVQLTHRMNDF